MEEKKSVKLGKKTAKVDKKKNSLVLMDKRSKKELTLFFNNLTNNFYSEVSKERQKIGIEIESMKLRMQSMNEAIHKTSLDNHKEKWSEQLEGLTRCFEELKKDVSNSDVGANQKDLTAQVSEVIKVLSLLTNTNEPLFCSLVSTCLPSILQDYMPKILDIYFSSQLPSMDQRIHLHILNLLSENQEQRNAAGVPENFHKTYDHLICRLKTLKDDMETKIETALSNNVTKDSSPIEKDKDIDDLSMSQSLINTNYDDDIKNLDFKIQNTFEAFTTFKNEILAFADNFGARMAKVEKVSGLLETECEKNASTQKTSELQMKNLVENLSKKVTVQISQSSSVSARSWSSSITVNKKRIKALEELNSKIRNSEGGFKFEDERKETTRRRALRRLIFPVSIPRWFKKDFAEQYEYAKKNNNKFCENCKGEKDRSNPNQQNENLMNLESNKHDIFLCEKNPFSIIYGNANSLKSLLTKVISNLDLRIKQQEELGQDNKSRSASAKSKKSKSKKPASSSPARGYAPRGERGGIRRFQRGRGRGENSYN